MPLFLNAKNRPHTIFLSCLSAAESIIMADTKWRYAMKTLAILAASVISAVATTGFAAEPAATPPRVLVIPFNVLNMPENQQWIGKGVQENLVADIGRGGTFSPIAFQGQVVVEDN